MQAATPTAIHTTSLPTTIPTANTTASAVTTATFSFWRKLTAIRRTLSLHETNARSSSAPSPFVNPHGDQSGGRRPPVSASSRVVRSAFAAAARRLITLATRSRLGEKSISLPSAVTLVRQRPDGCQAVCDNHAAWRHARLKTDSARRTPRQSTIQIRRQLSPPTADIRFRSRPS